MTHANTYRIISTFDGSITSCSLSELSRNLKLNTVLCELNTDGSLIDSWPLVHETLVTFAVEFADYALKNYTQQKSHEAEVCIALTRKWLENHDSVSVEELRVAANAAYADAAANGAATTAAADAATTAAHAATTAAYAADAVYAATNAAYAAAYAAGKNKESELIRQGQFIVGYLRAGT